MKAAVDFASEVKKKESTRGGGKKQRRAVYDTESVAELFV